MRNEIRRRNYSRATEKTYIYSVKRYIYFHNKQHPKDLNSAHIEQFLAHPATSRRVSGTTQALNAVVFLYKQTLKHDVGELDYLRNIRRFKNIPTVLSKEEVVRLLQQMQGTTKIMAALLYGAGVRMSA